MYFFRKKDPNRPTNGNLKAMHIINAIAIKKVDERLLQLLEKKSAISQSKTIVTTHEQLANELGTARVVVSRLLKQLEDAGKLKLGRNKIVLSDS